MTLEVRGEIDGLTAGELLDHLLAAVEDSRGARLLVDLSQVEFLSAAGLGALAQAHARASERGVAICLGPVSRIAHRVLHLTGISDYFDSWPTSPPPRPTSALTAELT